MNDTGTAIVWFRRDLRLTDNPALSAACEHARHVIALYVHAPEEDGEWVPGGASRWWLHHSLARFDESLRARGGRLTIRRGASLETLLAVARETGATHVYWNRLYDPARDFESAGRDEVLVDPGEGFAVLTPQQKEWALVSALFQGGATQSKWREADANREKAKQELAAAQQSLREILTVRPPDPRGAQCDGRGRLEPFLRRCSGSPRLPQRARVAAGEHGTRGSPAFAVRRELGHSAAVGRA